MDDRTIQFSFDEIEILADFVKYYASVTDGDLRIFEVFKGWFSTERRRTYVQLTEEECIGFHDKVWSMDMIGTKTGPFDYGPKDFTM